MHHPMVKEPCSSQQYVTSIHWDYGTPNLIMIVFANGEGYKASRIDLQSFTLIKPLDVARVSVSHSL